MAPDHPTGIDKLVAGRAPATSVSEALDLAATPAPRAQGGPVPFYTNPAVRHAAATGVDVGRSLDIKG